MAFAPWVSWFELTGLDSMTFAPGCRGLTYQDGRAWTDGIAR